MRFAGILFSFLRDAATVRQLGEDLVAFCAEYESTAFAMGGQMLRGWAIAQQGDVEQGLPLVRWGVDEEFQRGVRHLEPHNRSLLAETLALAGEWEEALDEVTAALAYAEECGNYFWNAHLYKLQGDFLHALSYSPQEVEAYYQRAIDTAHRQGAKSLELRATTSLARLWQKQGKQVEARQTLLEIYSWFTEGFGTVDLLEAKALLDECSSP
jgi:adenylate cyclase